MDLFIEKRGASSVAQCPSRSYPFLYPARARDPSLEVQGIHD